LFLKSTSRIFEANVLENSKPFFVCCKTNAKNILKAKKRLRIISASINFCRFFKVDFHVFPEKPHVYCGAQTCGYTVPVPRRRANFPPAWAEVAWA
jgi:hypothetical protein